MPIKRDHMGRFASNKSTETKFVATKVTAKKTKTVKEKAPKYLQAKDLIHGMGVTGYIDSTKIEGAIYKVNDGNFFFLQNIRNGSTAPLLAQYKYSWQFRENHSYPSGFSESVSKLVANPSNKAKFKPLTLKNISGYSGTIDKSRKVVMYGCKRISFDDVLVLDRVIKELGSNFDNIMSNKEYRDNFRSSVNDLTFRIKNNVI